MKGIVKDCNGNIQIMGQGIVTFKLTDDDGREHNIIIKNVCCVPLYYFSCFHLNIRLKKPITTFLWKKVPSKLQEVRISF